MRRARVNVGASVASRRDIAYKNHWYEKVRVDLIPVMTSKQLDEEIDIEEIPREYRVVIINLLDKIRRVESSNNDYSELEDYLRNKVDKYESIIKKLRKQHSENRSRPKMVSVGVDPLEGLEVASVPSKVKGKSVSTGTDIPEWNLMTDKEEDNLIPNQLKEEKTLESEKEERTWQISWQDKVEELIDIKINNLRREFSESNNNNNKGGKTYRKRKDRGMKLRKILNSSSTSIKDSASVSVERPEKGGGDEQIRISREKISTETQLKWKMQRRNWRRRCYRCYNWGHVGYCCNSNKIRAGMCFRCGERSHSRNECNKRDPKCPLCRDLRRADNHELGGAECLPPPYASTPVYEEGGRGFLHGGRFGINRHGGNRNNNWDLYMEDTAGSRMGRGIGKWGGGLPLAPDPIDGRRGRMGRWRYGGGGDDTTAVCCRCQCRRCGL